MLSLLRISLTTRSPSDYVYPEAGPIFSSRFEVR